MPSLQEDLTLAVALRVCLTDAIIKLIQALSTGQFAAAQGRELGEKLGKDLRDGDIRRDVSLEDYLVQKAVTVMCGTGDAGPSGVDPQLKVTLFCIYLYCVCD